MPTAGSNRERILMAMAGDNVGPLPDDAGNNIDNLLIRIAKGGASAGMIADAYDATSTYSKDDLCTHEGKLYKANQAISTAEEWDETHWTETTVAGEMGNASGMEKIAVSGSTPSITAESNKLSITPPASGICGVIFESGSTATVLTLGSGITCPEWFDDENLEADTIYELNINEGLLSVGMWGAS